MLQALPLFIDKVQPSACALHTMLPDSEAASYQHIDLLHCHCWRRLAPLPLLTGWHCRWLQLTDPVTAIIMSVTVVLAFGEVL